MLYHLEKIHEKLNQKNRTRLINKNFSLICSNCAGGILYHWLGLEFRSPFINLFMSNEDFIIALENLEEFLNFEIVEVNDTNRPYPVGESIKGIRINFMHFSSFEEAIQTWNRRKQRLNLNNLAIMLTNLSEEGNSNRALLQRFDRLPFKNKVVFVNRPHPEISSAFYIKGWKQHKKNKVVNIWRTQNFITGKRYIDQFDYITFFNNLSD